MRSILSKLINGKRILILGFGREGEATLAKLMEAGCAKSLTVADRTDVSDRLPGDVTCISGDGYQDAIEDNDVVFKSPGVVLEKSPDEISALVTSETEIFMQAYGDRVIGVTGTKGKSTTSSLIYHVLKETGRDAVFGGNIGIPVFELADSIARETVIVLELSCHQLEYLKTDPHVAVLLNIYEDHLDHYGTRERYAMAKKKIFSRQGEVDLLFTTKECFEKENIKEFLHSRLVIVSEDDAPFESFDSVPGVRLIGGHNRLNCAFAFKVLERFGVSKEEFLKALSTFTPLEHRLEKFLSADGRDYYDDSISTTVRSAISAVEAVDNAGILLLGGMERNLDYDELTSYLRTSKLDHVICMYDSGRRIYEALAKDPGCVGVTYVNDLDGAVTLAMDLLKPGKAMILSPAAASYGFFKNFEERGRRFKELVNDKLKK